MGHIWTTLALCLIYFSGKALVNSAEYLCFSFDNTDEGWLIEYGYPWQWSGVAFPDATNIPAFQPTSQYLWFQNQDTPPVSGAVRSPASYTLYYGDTIQAKIFRHMLEDDTISPILRFVTATSTVQDVLSSTEQDWWSTISVTCTNVADWEMKQAQCCPSYPCTGYFRLDGEVLVRDELLGIDDIGINGACDAVPPPPPPPTTPTTTTTTTTTTKTTTTTTTTTTPPPTPANWCCNFQTSDICDWSPAHIRDGWFSSLEFPYPDIELITSDEYIYVVDTSAAVISTNLTAVPNIASFHIIYYYSSSDGTIGDKNKLVASFTSSTGITSDLGPLLQTGGKFNSQILSSSGFCGGEVTCTGTFSLTTYNTPGIEQIAALQHFAINSAVC